MSDAIIKQVKNICRLYNIKPQKSKSQNFLINPTVIHDMIAAADIQPGQAVLEIGPGLGVLTEKLVQAARRVISVELDSKLFGFLQAKFSGASNLELINEDILKFNPASYKLQATSYKIVANLPYHITSIVLRKFLTMPYRPAAMTILIQKEVAERICAKPGQMSLLALSVQAYGQPDVIKIVDKNNFWPVPEVDSAILRISKIKSQTEVDNLFSEIGESAFWRLVKIGFSARRKQLQNNLAAGLKISANEAKKSLASAGFNPQIRPQNLSVLDWLRLAKLLKN